MRIKTGLLAAGLALALSTAAPFAAGAQTPPPSPTVPTTRILAIGTLVAGVDPRQVAPILPSEVRATARLYLDGKIDQWYSLTAGRGVVFILNVTDPAAAKAMLEQLPLGQAHLMSFELMPLGPLGPLRLLAGPPPAP